MDELNFEYKYRISERYKNVYFLNDEYVSINDDFNVYGTTFWTKPPFLSTSDARQYINDYNNIKFIDYYRNTITKLNVEHVNALSKLSLFKLKQYLSNSKKHTIILTHFPPISDGTLSRNSCEYNPNGIMDKYNAWPNETIKSLNLSYVPFWISGHTHYSYNMFIDGCHFISNQLGYNHDLGTNNLNDNGVFTLRVN